MCTAGAPSKSPMTVYFYSGQLIRTGLALWSLKRALAVHLNLPLLSFNSTQLSKLGLPLLVSLFLWNIGDLVNGHEKYTCGEHCLKKNLPQHYQFWSNDVMQPMTRDVKIGPMLSVSQNVHMCVCMSVCVSTFEVPFNVLFAPHFQKLNVQNC